MNSIATLADVQVNRNLFERFENHLLSLPQIQESGYQLKEYVSGGLYCRQITIPKGACITGRIYKFDHVEILLSGDISILAADGGEKRHSGLKVIEAQSGKRQAGFAHEETVWLTINPVPDIPLDKMLDWTSVLTYDDYYRFHEALDVADYANFLAGSGLSEDEMESLVRSEDVVDMPEAFAHIKTAPSFRQGDGLFSDITLRRGEHICPTLIGGKRTIAGRYSNHGLHANSAPCIKDGEFYAIAVRDIPAGDEITINYRDVLKFREGLRSGICLDG